MVPGDWNAWWTLSEHEKGLYWAFLDGTLLEERNEAAKAFGHGFVYNEREETIAQTTMESCFTYKTIEQTLYRSMQFAMADRGCGGSNR